MNYQLISSDIALSQVCKRARKKKHIALDTEFIRIRTYYPQLGLIQLYDGEQLSLIDPLLIKQWHPFVALLTDTQVSKFLHASSEDLDVFIEIFKTLPIPMIDTQILAAFSGRSLSCSLATLVLEYMHIKLDKSEVRTDWLARPLTEKQCIYAAADVFYLLPIAKQLMQEVEKLGWSYASYQESLLLCQRRSKVLLPELAYRKISNVGKLNVHQVACLQKLAEWRLQYARKRNLAVNFVVREEKIWKVAHDMPRSLEALISLGLSKLEIRYHGHILLKLVDQASILDTSVLFKPLLYLAEYPGYKTVFKDIKTAIGLISKCIGLNSELLASRRQINQLLNWHWKLQDDQIRPELMNHWRKDLLEESIQNILKNYSLKSKQVQTNSE